MLFSFTQRTTLSKVAVNILCCAFYDSDTGYIIVKKILTKGVFALLYHTAHTESVLMHRCEPYCFPVKPLHNPLKKDA